MAGNSQNPWMKVERSHLRYSLADGVDELLRGVDMALIGAALVILRLALREQIDYGWFAGAIVVSLIASIASGRLKERIRQRVTYPRIGYLSEEPGEPFRLTLLWPVLLIFLPGAIVLTLVTVLLVTGNLPDWRTAVEWGRWLPAVLGIPAGAAYWWDSARSGFVRLRVSAVMIAAVGIAASVVSADLLMAFALFLIGYGVVNVAAGGITLWRFSTALYDTGTP